MELKLLAYLIYRVFLDVEQVMEKFNVSNEEAQKLMHSLVLAGAASWSKDYKDTVFYNPDFV